MRDETPRDEGEEEDAWEADRAYIMAQTRLCYRRDRTSPFEKEADELYRQELYELLAEV